MGNFLEFLRRNYIIIIVIVLIIILFNLFHVPKDIEYVMSLDDIPEPIQEDASGGIQLTEGKWDVDIDYIAEYEITGKVVGTYRYYDSTDLEQVLSPIDVGLVWGDLVDEDNIHWRSSGNRFLYWSTDNETVNKLGGERKLTEQYSNNHLIPADSEIEKEIKEIEVDDYIKIEGYLVNIYATKPNGEYFYWNSSTDRNDSGDGACEVIYVEDIVWLEKE